MAQSSSSAPDFFPPEKRHSSDHFIVDDLLNFPSDDTDDHHHLLPPALPHSANSSVVTTNSTVEGPSGTLASDTQFSHDLCDPYDAELEWLSNFVEESFSSTDLEKLHLLSGVRSQPIDVSETHQLDHDIDTRNTNSVFNTDMTVPAKARTKRSRGAPRSWTSRLVLSGNPTTMVSSESESDISSSLTSKKSVKSSTKKKDDDNESHSGEGRRCLHCATDKTPQWRTGPLGPKTLCNACGVRYKSGRLVPEYRPASSPTFVLTKHSNSHRKVLELRRQKETQSAHQLPFFHHQNMMFDVSKGEDYLIHQHIGLDYRQLI